MATVTTRPIVRTVEEMLELPDDGFERRANPR